MNKILVFDIGNSETDIALFYKDKIQRRYALENNSLSRLTNDLSGLYNETISEIYIGSVNPKITKLLQPLCRKIFFIEGKVVGYTENVKLKINYSPKNSLGIDRLANAVAAFQQYPTPLVVIDMGTATTFNIVSSKGVFLGGAISVGLNTARDTLHKQTALLPSVELSKKGKQKVIGNSTRESLQSGLLQGFGSMVDGMVERIRKELKIKKLTVIATGGNSGLINPYSQTIQYIDPDLTLKGIYYLGIQQ